METKFDLRARASEIKSMLLRGDVTYDQAKEMLRPAVEEAERRAEKIAKQFKKKAPKFSLTALLR